MKNTDSRHSRNESTKFYDRVIFAIYVTIYSRHSIPFIVKNYIRTECKHIGGKTTTSSCHIQLFMNDMWSFVDEKRAISVSIIARLA